MRLSSLVASSVGVAAIGLSACVPPPPPPLGKPAWPEVSDEVNVRPSLKQWLHDHPEPKVVLRVPRAMTNVAEAESAATATDSGHAYDLVEKAFFKKGFTVRDRAMLANLLKDDKINSYKEIKSRVDTDLIVEISSLRFNDAGDLSKTTTYENGEGPEAGSAVATMEVKIINVETGEVGALMTLRQSLCSDPAACQGRPTASSRGPQKEYSEETDIRAAKKAAAHAHAAKKSRPGARHVRFYYWEPGAEPPAGMDLATDRLAAKLVGAMTP